ncbi:MAG: tetratricopeptide repeat protein, partial [Terriglobia bacterium]
MGEESYQRGVQLLERARFAEARAEFERALAERPEWVEARINLGVACLELGLLDEALAAFERTRVLAPESEEVYYNLGVAYEKKR